jgi:hypothetical protein
MRRIVPAALTVLVACMLLAPRAGGAQEGRSVFSALDTQGRTVAVGEVAQGSLTPADVLSAGGRRVQVWTLGAIEGQEVQVDLRSDDFDAFLYVVGPGLDEGLRDDDGGSGLNSRICFVPDQPGEYRVVASSLYADIGAFSITASATDGSCGGAVETSEIEDLTQFPTGDRTLAVGDEVAGELTDADATFYGSPTQAWAVQGTAGQPFAVDLVSDDFDAFLTVLGPGLDEYLTDDDGAGRCDSRVSLTFPESGEYRVLASAVGVGAGSFTLIASESPGPVNPESCIPPMEEGEYGEPYEYIEGSLEEIAIMGGLPLEGAVDGAMTGDEGFFRDRPLQGWTLEGMAGNRVAITLASDRFDTYLFFDGPGFPDPLWDDDSAGDRNSRICVELPETGTYRVFAGPFSSADPGSPYRLDATVRGADAVCGDYDLSPAATVAALASLDTEGRTIGVNEEQMGTLTGEVRDPEAGRPLQPWTLRAPPGTFFYVDVVGHGFDAYLYVLGGGLEGVLTADDFGGTLNPRLEMTMPASGEVLLLPSAFGESTRGDFLLRVSTNPPPMEEVEGPAATGTMTDAGELMGLGLPVGDLPLGAEVYGVLGEGDDVISRGYAQAFTFEAAAGQDVAFEVVSDDFDTYLYVTGPGLAGALSDDDGGSSTNSRIEVSQPEGGTYTVVVSAFGEGTGAFRLRAFRMVR